MTDDRDEPATAPQPPARNEPRRDGPVRRRPDLDAIFGDVLPDTTSDERDPAPSTEDDWYERNRPPHHG